MIRRIFPQVLCCLALMSFSCILSAQEKFAFANSRGMSIFAAEKNPAAMMASTSTFQLDILSLDVNVRNDAVRISSMKDLLEGAKDNDMKNLVSYKDDGMPKKLDFTLDASLLNLIVATPRAAYGFGVRLRGNVLAHDIGESLIAGFMDGVNPDDENVSSLFNSAFGDFKLYGDIFSEVKLSFARRLLTAPRHRIDLGFSLKYLTGLYTARGLVDDMDAAWDRENSLITINRAAGTAVYYKKDFEEAFKDVDFNTFFGGKEFGGGFGADAGLSYEYHRDGHDRYMFKLGAAVQDIGTIKYKEDLYLYDVNVTHPVVYNTDEDFGEDPEMDDILSKLKDDFMGSGEVTEHTGEYKMQLPTTVYLSFDWHVGSVLSLGANAVLPVSDEMKTASPTGTLLNLMPRIETGPFMLAVPFTYSNRYEKVLVGIGVNLGGLFIGSDDLLGLLQDEFYGANFYIGYTLSVGRRN
ncbi:MAG: hypothetical protein IKI72_09625 [Bacteroidales bacterium]|nr:hypothetical protein [Bacteroidales bacterium]